MNDGTINNRVFNATCIATCLFLLYNIFGCIVGAILESPELLLETFNSVYRITMVFLLTFFAYDSAKHQLKKTNLSK